MVRSSGSTVTIPSTLTAMKASTIGVKDLARRSVVASQKIDPDVFEEVAASYLESRSALHDTRVVAAYAQLEVQTDSMFARLSRSLRIVFTRCPLPYSSDVEMIHAVRSRKLLEVSTSSINAENKHPMLNGEFGGAYDRFRAVHDVCGHAMPGVGFDRQGEFVAWLHQDRHYRGVARLALATELHGRNSVLCTTGNFAESKAMLLDASLLTRSKRGLTV
jgi:hypothetical protein